MAKKVQKGKPAKKAAKPAKKAVAKKPAKKTAKKTAPKKAAKPAKKAAPKKVVKKTAPKKAAAKKAPVKKVIAKKVVAKKVAPKKVAKKVAPKKIVVKKKVAKKVAPKKAAAKKAQTKKIVIKKVVVNKAAPKKVAPKKVLPPPAKSSWDLKIEAKRIDFERRALAERKRLNEKPIPLAPKKTPPTPKKKQELSIDMDDDVVMDEAPMIVEYKTPSIRKPMGPAPIPHINNDKRTRYTDTELKEFKQLIIKKLTEAQKDYELLKSTLSHRDDHGTDDTSPTFKLLEDGSDVLSKEETAHIAGRQEKFIQNLQNALIRIENKTYGICRATGKLISKERLRSVPHATLAIEAKLIQKT